MAGGDSGSQGPGPDEQALASIATQAFQRQQAVYNPIIKKYAQVADDGKLTEQRLAGSSNVATQQAFGQATPGAVGTALRRGGSVGDTLAGVQAGKTQSEASGQSGAVSQGKNVQLSELGQVIGFGRGQATQATTGLGQVAQQQTNEELQNAQLAANQRSQIGSAAIGLAGIGYGAYKGATAPQVGGGTIGPGGQATPEIENQGEGGNWAGFDFSGNTDYGMGP